MTRRMWVLFGALILAAMPMVWLSVDPDAGETLLRLTQPNVVRDQAARPSHGAIERTASIGTVAAAPSL